MNEYLYSTRPKVTVHDKTDNIGDDQVRYDDDNLSESGQDKMARSAVVQRDNNELFAINHADLPGNTRLSEISMLGSHDAGTYAYSRARSGFASSLGSLLPFAFKTQKLTLKEQAKAGVNYFDIRVAERKDGSFGFFHGPSVAGGDALADVLDLLSYAKQDNKNFYLFKFVFKGDKPKKGTITTNLDNFLRQALNGFNENLITAADTSSLAMTPVSILDSGKNMGVMVDKYHGENNNWQYKEQTYTKWANRANAEKTASFLTKFHATPAPEDKLTIVQTNMPVASVKKGEISLGVKSYLGRKANVIAAGVDRIENPGIIGADYIGHNRSAAQQLKAKVDRSNAR